MWEIYYNLGFEHILDIKGYDHMLFLLALCIPFTIKDGKKVFILASAFTIGHSLTLALNVLDLVSFPSHWIEFFIPLTIVLTVVIDFFQSTKSTKHLHYILAMIFGLIHGMGFSQILKSSMFPGEESKFLWQLLYFNIGIEVGQIIIVIIILLFLTSLAYLSSKIIEKRNLKTKTTYLTHQKIIASSILLWAGYLCIERFPL